MIPTYNLSGGSSSVGNRHHYFRPVPALLFVVPCYNEESILPSSITSLLTEIDSLGRQGLCSPQESGILLVDDGSRDSTWQRIEFYARQDTRISGLKLSRNKGHQAALLAGLTAAVNHSDVSISIDADLQDDLSVCSQMLSHYMEGCDIVYGVRGSRKTDTPSKRFFANAFYSLMLMLGVELVPGHADFRLMSKQAVKELLRFDERSLFLRGLIPQLGFRSSCVYYARKTRESGISKYPFRKSLALAINGVVSFSFKPLRLIALLGFITAFISFLGLVLVLVTFASGGTVQGWASLMTVVTTIGGLQLLAIGVLGEYIGRIYTEVKRRPLYHVQSISGALLASKADMAELSKALP